MSVLSPASQLAAPITNLFWVTFAISAVLLAIVAGLVVYMLIRFRDRGEEGEPYQRFGHRNLEILWTAIPVLTLVVVFGLTVRTMQEADPPADPQAQPDLQIIGHQWWWELRYLKAGVFTANEIHVPAGRSLLVELDSADVIHNFWVPQLSRKLDLTPNYPTRLWLRADSPGTYLGACGEYCGDEHAWMLLRVIAQPADQFDAWLKGQQATPPAPSGGDAAQGATLFAQLPCSNCHTVSGTSAKGKAGPDLTHLASRETIGAGVRDNNLSNLTLWLRDPQAIKPGALMPNMKLSDDQIRQLAAYLETLK